MIKLFIENNEIEITDDIQVAITKQFEELSNPTTIINDWSKTVSIPFTVNNNKTFGNIYRLDKLITYKPSTNYLSTAPNSIKKWNGSEYVNDSLVNGEIVCPINVQYLQVGFQYQDWRYSTTKNYRCTNDFHTFEFIYNSTEDYRFEFSFRDMASSAPNQEVYYVQWELNGRGLTSGKTYVVSFRHRSDGNNYIIYDYSLSERESFVGLNFNPLKKLDFRIEWDNDILMTGYAKMNDIKQVGGKGTYNITLFGKLGKIFQEMQKITFDTSTEDTQYLIKGEEYVDETITRTLVNSSWTSSGQTSVNLLKKDNPYYSVTDIIGFVPNNSFSEGFKHDTFQASSDSSQIYSDYLDDTLGFRNATGIDAATVIPNGFLPREVGDYRSYLQLPYIYWNKLFQIFQSKSEALTGYQFDLDSSWFTSSNPYWYNLVYMLEPLNLANKKGKPESANSYKTQNSNHFWQRPTIVAITGARTEGYTGVTTTSFSDFDIKQETMPINVSGNTFQVQQNTKITMSGGFNVRLTSSLDASSIVSGYGEFGNNNALILKIVITGNNSNVLTRQYIVARKETTNTGVQSLIAASNGVVYLEGRGSTDSNGKLYFDVYVPVDAFSINTFTVDTGFTMSYTTEWYNHQVEGQVFTQPSGTVPRPGGGSVVQPYACDVTTDSTLSLTMNIKEGVFYSGSKFILNDLWNKDFKLFDEILKYCKIYRINISVDDFNKKIVFKRVTKFFENYSTVNWTDKIDKSKDFTIKPVTFENKYVLFNYKDSKTDLGEEYKKKYGVNYGDYRLTTEYNFNDEKTELFKDVTPSIVSTDNVLSYYTLSQGSISYTVGAEIFPYNKDKDKKQVDIFGAYFFHNGLANFDVGNGSDLLGVKITDDSAWQQVNNTFFYTAIQTDSVYVTTYPKLDVVKGNNMCIFNVPKENYTYINNYAGKNTIYSNFWEVYLNERYNTQNKLLTCYVNLKPTDYNRFNFNKLVLVDNQLCVVNKIYDYDINSSTPTKVDLVTIQDVDGYTTDNYNS